MARTPSSKNKSTLMANYIKSKSQIRKEKYKFKVGDIVYCYSKTLYEYLENLEGIIMRRSTSKSKINYRVRFIIDGKEKDLYLRESFLSLKYEQIEMKLDLEEIK